MSASKTFAPFLGDLQFCFIMLNDLTMLSGTISVKIAACSNCIYEVLSSVTLKTIVNNETPQYILSVTVKCYIKFLHNDLNLIFQ